ncbi:MAG: peptidoglycan-binding protein [Nitrospira sp.]|nr:peptidoglycan-binding protein [Nitrospira sp.]
MSYILNNEGLGSWIRKEVELAKTLKKGARGQPIKRVQEWLNLHEFGLVIDGDFGSVTKRKVAQFQDSRGLDSTGTVNAKTFQELVAPLWEVLQPITTVHQFPRLVLAYAKVHLKQHPREVGGQNCGPWVRLYMKGHEGEAWPWCAGFVTFLLKQAAQTLQMTPPIQGSFSCDTLVAQAKDAGLFVKESDLSRGDTYAKELSLASIFLVRRTSTDWTHTGLSSEFNADSFDTIEGNTNDEGSREGYEVCARTRGYGKKDFILL